MNRDDNERICKALVIYAETLLASTEPDLKEYNRVEVEEAKALYLRLGGDNWTPKTPKLKATKEIKKRLEYLRGELKAERISYGELAELQDLAPYIADGDVELLEAAGVSEEEARANGRL